MQRLPTWPVAAGSLVLGFAVADLTGVRPLGGLVLFFAALWCGLTWRTRRGLPIALALVAFYLIGFALSHRVDDAVGSAWGGVLLVSAVVGLVAWAAGDRERPPDVESVV